jgi:hypothetical protein
VVKVIKKGWKLLTFSVMVVLFTLLIFYFVKNVLRETYSKDDLNNVDYETNVELMINHFPGIENITAAYWKVGRYGRSVIGPSDIWLKGFIVLEDIDYNKIESTYEWHEIQIVFEDGINPEITGFNDFNWYSSDDFSRRMNRNVYMGDFYLDKINKVLYFNLSTY